MTPLSQRDQRWANLKLGDSNYTIGPDGCTITCLAMAANLTPGEINRRMNLVGALKGGLVNWTLIGKANIGLEFIWRNKGWLEADNAKVLQAIVDYGFCLAEVDFDGNPKTTGKHWILLIGNKRAYDPWTGTEIDTSKYSTFTGYAILKRTGQPVESNNMNMYKGYDLSNAESMKVAVDKLVLVMKGDLIDKSKYDTDIKKLEDKIADLSKPQIPATEIETSNEEGKKLLASMLPNGGKRTFRDDGSQEIEISYKLKD